jgi:hypothetical protein
MPKFPWGKFKGDEIEDIPSSYIVWLLDNGKVRDPLLARELGSEMIRRMQSYAPNNGRHSHHQDGSVGDAGAHEYARNAQEQRPSPTITKGFRAELALKVVEKGYRVVAREVHPDTGGTAEAFKELTSVLDALRKMVGKV